MKLASIVTLAALGLPLTALAQPPTSPSARVLQFENNLVVCLPVPPVSEHLGPGAWVTICMPIVPVPRQCIETALQLDCSPSAGKPHKGA
jgi:hypothetical protein